MKNIKKILFATAILGILLAPSLSSATTIAEIQAQLNAILQKVQQLQQQLNQYSSGIIYTTPTPTPTSPPAQTCNSVWDCSNGTTACIAGKCMSSCYHGYTYNAQGNRYCGDKCYPPNIGCPSGQTCSSSFNGCEAGSTLSPSCAISFTPSSIGPGQSTTVRWSSQNDADNLLDYSCTTIGSGQGAIGASGSLTYLYNDIYTVIPAKCTLTAKNSQNQTASCSANISKTSTVCNPACLSDQSCIGGRCVWGTCGDKVCNDCSNAFSPCSINEPQTCPSDCGGITPPPPPPSNAIDIGPDFYTVYPNVKTDTIPANGVKNYYFRLNKTVSNVVVVLASLDWATDQDFIVSMKQQPTLEIYNQFKHENTSTLRDPSATYWFNFGQGTLDKLTLPGVGGNAGDMFYVTVFNVSNQQGRYQIYWYPY